MSSALDEHYEKARRSGRTISNLRFADGIDALKDEEQEIDALVESLDKTYTRYKDLTNDKQRQRHPEGD